MRRTTFDENRDQKERLEAPPVSHNCPAYGCPNAASTSFDGSRWACYFHAKAPFDTWPAVTTQIRHDWPKSSNWNHPEKVAHEAEQAALRRAKLPAARGPVGMVGIAEVLGEVL